jgi:hypothetical protein
MKLGCVRPLGVALSLACVASGCAAGAREHAGVGDVTVAVRNSSQSSIDVRVAHLPDACPRERWLPVAKRSSAFRLKAARAPSSPQSGAIV